MLWTNLILKLFKSSYLFLMDIRVEMYCKITYRKVQNKLMLHTDKMEIIDTTNIIFMWVYP